MPYLASFIISALTFIGLYNYLPLDWVAFNQGVKNFGATITTIQGSDTLSASRSVINTNFSNLNDFKIENSTTSVAAITTLANLSTVGTIASGVWNGTAVTVPYGGTGSTTLGSNLVLLGNGTSNVKTVTGLGSSGEVLMSNGAGSAPSWQSSSVNQTSDYNWTGHHIFTSLFATLASTTNATSTASHYFPFVTSSILKTDSAGKLTAATANTDYLATTKFISTTTQAVYTGAASGTLWSQSVLGGTLSTNNGLRGKFYVSWNSQSTTAKNIDLNFGGTDCASASTGSLPAATSITTKGYIEFLLLANAATGAQVCSVQFQLYENEGGVGGTDEAYLIAADDGTAAVDSTVDRTLSLTFDHNSSGDSLTILHGVVEYIR